MTRSAIPCQQSNSFSNPMPRSALDDKNRSAVETNSASDSNLRYWASDIDSWVAWLFKMSVVAFANEVEPGGILGDAFPGD